MTSRRRRQLSGSRVGFILLPAIFALFCGCSSVTNHEILGLIFDGVPRLPPPDEFCTDYQAKLERDQQAKKGEGGKKSSGIHRPYAEKHCDSCHDKEKEGGLIKPPRELCGVCHTGFLKGRLAHGPAAVGECLACHLPHSSTYPSLLKRNVNELCSMCHQEPRVSGKMHDSFTHKGLSCVDCHDPHSADGRLFLK